MFRLLSLMCGVCALYPFTTSSGGPVCKVPSCVSCNVATVEYSQSLSVKNVTHHIVGGSFWESEITGGLCCGDNCGSQGNILTQGYGECVDTGESRRSWDCGLCEDARCRCRRVSYEIIPTECVKCLANYSLTPSAQCSLCPTGYTGDGVTCRALDLCVSGGHNCDKHATCSYTGPGRFMCSCFRGYSGNGVFCAEIDVCALDSHACHPLATCSKTGPGLFSCACQRGYEGDGRVCRDINECAGTSRACLASEFCENTPGSYTCTPCHEECAGGCVGAGPDQCQDCKGFSNEGSCVKVCPLTTFADQTRLQCRPCDSECLAECTGEGRQACKACAHVSFTTLDKSTICLAECPAGYFALRTLFGHVCTVCSASRPGSFISINCSTQEDTVFTMCSPGYRCTGRSGPEKCESGYFQSEANQSECEAASAGFFAQAALYQQRCGVGFVSGEGAARCESCPLGRRANVAQSECEDVNECEFAKSNCTQGTVCRNTEGGFACDTVVVLAEKAAPWAWAVFGLGIVCCLLACIALCVWHSRRKKVPLKVEGPEDVALTTLEEHEGLVGPGSTKAVPQETNS